MSQKLERRFIIATEVRAETADGKKVLTGYAAKYDKMSHNLGGFNEVIKPGAFDRAIKEKQDVKMLINHDPNQIVGRSGKNLELSTDKVGLRFRVQLPNTQMANDLHENVRNGIMEQCSFGFITKGDRWLNARDGGFKDVQYEGVEDKQALVRELHDLDLRDVSIVTDPAYPQTEVKARSGVTAVEIRSLFPDGIPQEVAKHMAEETRKLAEEQRSVKYLVPAGADGGDGKDHLPYTDEDGKPNHNLMGAAWAALHGGYRGQKYAGPNKTQAIEKLTGVYKSEGMDTPAESKSLLDSTVEVRHDKIQDIAALLPKVQDAMKALDECADDLLDAIDGGDMEGYDEGNEKLAPEIKALAALLDALEKAVDKENTEEESSPDEEKERALKLRLAEVALKL